MWTFFDYAYYRICKFYYENRDSGARFGGLAVLSVIQFLNIFIVFWVICFLLRFTIHNNKLIVILGYFVIVVLNGFRYNKLNYDVLDAKWKDEDVRTQKKK